MIRRYELMDTDMDMLLFVLCAGVCSWICWILELGGNTVHISTF